MLPARLLINAQVVNEQRLEGYHVGGKRLLLQLTEGIAHAHIILVCGNVDGLVLLLQKFCQLTDGVFCGAGNKNIRADLCMDLQYLPQQRKQSGNVFFLGFTNVHFLLLPFSGFCIFSIPHRAAPEKRKCKLSIANKNVSDHFGCSRFYMLDRLLTQDMGPAEHLPLFCAWERGFSRHGRGRPPAPDAAKPADPPAGFRGSR